jgi:hypothetical protein
VNGKRLHNRPEGTVFMTTPRMKSVTLAASLTALPQPFFPASEWLSPVLWTGREVLPLVSERERAESEIGACTS